MINAHLCIYFYLCTSQGTKATIIAEEVVGNMRTVRAFASETAECERFLTEIENNGILHKKLGNGIGLFQVCVLLVFIFLISYLVIIFLI